MRRAFEEKFDISLWQPRTSIGKAVKEGKIASISEILRGGQRPREPEIVDALVPNLEEDVLGISMVQRMHKSGRRTKYRVITVVGNRDGIVGVAHASTREVGPSIRKAVTAAKLNIIEVARGCGSWECGCGDWVWRLRRCPRSSFGWPGSRMYGPNLKVKPGQRLISLSLPSMP